MKLEFIYYNPGTRRKFESIHLASNTPVPRIGEGIVLKDTETDEHEQYRIVDVIHSYSVGSIFIYLHKKP